MSSELPLSADALLAERARLEEELQSNEDWCELLRLKSRKDRGEGMSAVNAARLEMVLIDALAEEPAFVRYKAVCVALERLIRGLPPLPPPTSRAKPTVEPDDLTRIRGVTASMARRLKALDVTTFAEIANWRSADIKSISADLGIGKQIYEQNWIEQAALLSNAGAQSVPAPLEIQPRTTPVPQPPPAQQYVQPVALREPAKEKQPAATIHVPDKQAAAPREIEKAAKDVMPQPAAKPVTPELKPDPHSESKLEPKSAPPPERAVLPETAAKLVLKPQPAPATPAAAPAAPVAKVVVADLMTSKPLLPPPAPLRPSHYGKAPDENGSHATRTEPQLAKIMQPVGPPPKPLMPQHYGKALDVAPSAGMRQPPQPKTSDVTAVAAAPPRPLPIPPKPLVITRASVADTRPCRISSNTAANSNTRGESRHACRASAGAGSRQAFAAPCCPAGIAESGCQFCGGFYVDCGSHRLCRRSSSSRSATRVKRSQ